MEPERAFERLRALLAPWLRDGALRLEPDDFDDVIVVARRDLTHLDADALNDRLHAWTKRELEPAHPCASAFVSFRNARPATLDEAELDLQEKWLDLEPTLRLELHRPEAGEPDVEAFAGLVPVFLALVDREGRPVGWRRPDVGNME